MDAKIVHHFLKASLEGLSQKEKEELCKLILNEQDEKPRKKVKKNPIMSKVEMKKKLMKSHFKSKQY